MWLTGQLSHRHLSRPYTRQLLLPATRQHYCSCVLHMKYRMLHSTSCLRIDSPSISKRLVECTMRYFQCTVYTNNDVAVSPATKVASCMVGFKVLNLHVTAHLGWIHMTIPADHNPLHHLNSRENTGVHTLQAITCFVSCQSKRKSTLMLLSFFTYRHSLCDNWLLVHSRSSTTPVFCSYLCASAWGWGAPGLRHCMCHKVWF